MLPVPLSPTRTIGRLSRVTRRLMASSVLFALAAVLTTWPAPAQESGEVNVYSYRQPQLIEPILDAFTAETGIGVNVIFAKQGLIERVEAEGANSPADVVLTVDIGRLVQAVNAGITQPVASSTLAENIPAQYRDPDGRWFGLTTRARVIYASKDRVAKGDVATYADLTNPRWQDKVCTRSGKHDYNVALIASIIAHKGPEAARDWLKGLKANLARKPQGNDRAQVKAIWQGECDMSLGNTYYMGEMLEDPEQRQWAESAYIVFPNQAEDQRGTHVNISGMVMARHAPNREEARKLMEYLTTDAAQALYAELNYEYPVKAGVEYSDLVRSWGTFRADDLPLSEIAKHRGAAIRLVDETGFDN